MKAKIQADMPFMVNDWLASTKIATMLPAQEGAFIRLLAHAWNDPDCTLPADDIELAALSRLGGDWERFGPKVKACFDPDPDRPGRIFNPKQRAVRAAQDDRIRRASEQRSGAANARWDKERAMRPQSGSNATALRTDVRPQSGSNAPYSTYSNTLSDKASSTKPQKLTGQRRHLAVQIESLLAEQWVNDAGKWVERIKENPSKCERVFAELKSAITESRIKTSPAQYAENLWKHFK